MTNTNGNPVNNEKYYESIGLENINRYTTQNFETCKSGNVRVSIHKEFDFPFIVQINKTTIFCETITWSKETVKLMVQNFVIAHLSCSLHVKLLNKLFKELKDSNMIIY